MITFAVWRDARSHPCPDPTRSSARDRVARRCSSRSKTCSSSPSPSNRLDADRAPRFARGLSRDEAHVRIARMGRVASVQVGLLAPLPGPGRATRSGIHKQEVKAGALLARDGVAGDEIGHPDVHGGPDQAVLFFSASNYAKFEERLGRRLPAGSFGENVTVEGLDERSVCLGDSYRVGEAEVEVTWPR